MNTTRIGRRLRYWLQYRQRARLLREEMDSHLAFKTEELIQAGLPEPEARSEARRRFGNVGRKFEESRGAWIARWMSDLGQDLVFAARTLRKQPGFAAVAILSAALGIGSCSTIFGIANFALFQPLPAGDPARLLSISRQYGEHGQTGATVSYPDVQALQQAHSFQTVTAFFPLLAMTITSGGEAQRYWGSLVTANYFDVVRPQFVLGHGFNAAKDDTPGEQRQVVLSHALWTSRFGADPDIVGRTIEMNRRKVVVAGVTAPNFRGTELALVSDFWVPFSMRDEVAIMKQSVQRLYDPGARWLFAIARLREGASLRAAGVEVQAIGKRLADERPASQKNWNFRVETAGRINPGLRAVLTMFFSLLLAATLMVLLIACANIANLLLARASARHKEIATRLAIGAGRGRLVRQLLTESILLAMFGGAGGCLLAYWAASGMGKLRLPIPIPLDLSVSLDYRLVCFCAGLAVLTGIVFGLAPALRATRTDLMGSLKDRTAALARSPRLSLRNALVVAQVAVCTLLLICSGLFLRSLYSSESMQSGIRNRNVLLVPFDPTLNHYTDAEARRTMREILDRAQALPGVESASLTSYMPLSLEDDVSDTVPEADKADASKKVTTHVYAVGPRFFETLGIPLLAGEDFRTSVAANADEAIVNQALADKEFPHQNPLGRRILRDDKPLRIIGVVATTQVTTVGESPQPCLYVPVLNHFEAQDALLGITLLVKTRGNPASFTKPVRDLVREVDPGLPIFDVRTLDTHLRNARILPRMAALMFGMCGGMGLLISSIGIYGVVSFAAARRTKEIGVRVALGARRGQILRMIVRQGLTLTVIGCGIGIAAALAASRVAAGLLYGISPQDTLTFVLTPLFLAAVAVSACLIPARRAAALDPVRTLHYE